MLGMSCGQFHGEMMPMTPIGWRMTRMRLLSVSSWIDGLIRAAIPLDALGRLDEVRAE